MFGGDLIQHWMAAVDIEMARLDLTDFEWSVIRHCRRAGHDLARQLPLEEGRRNAGEPR